MADNDFTIHKLTERFGLVINETKSLFGDVAEVDLPPTTGLSWRFLELEGETAWVDTVEYPIQSPRRIFGILTLMALGEEVPASVMP